MVKIGALCGSSRDTTFNLDTVNNRSSVVDTVSGTANYTPNEANEYDIIDSVNRAHDDKGNYVGLTNMVTGKYHWDYANRLACIYIDFNLNNKWDSGTDETEWVYTYDTASRRTMKQQGPQGSSTPCTRYVYSGWRVVQEYYDADGAGPGEYDKVAEYAYGNNLDEVLRMRRKDLDDADNDGDTSEWMVYYYHTDVQGSVAALTIGENTNFSDGAGGNLASGTVVEKYTYDVYGVVTIKDRNGVVLSQSKIRNPYLFQGRRLDEETGLYYFRNRYYDPAHGRFISRDPEGFIDGPNLYSFVNNNPINYTDPTGTFLVPFIIYKAVEYLSKSPEKKEEVQKDVAKKVGLMPENMPAEDCSIEELEHFFWQLLKFYGQLQGRQF